ncbi:MAG: hypothetical protein U0Z26_00780 [Anaerolineales bacterium]
MMNRTRYQMFVTTVLTVLVLSAMRTMPALADDGVPPPLSTDVPVVVEPQAVVVAIESAPVETVPALAEEEASVIVNPTAPLIDEPLSESNAPSTVIDGDPLWCPAGVAPKAGTGGCSPSFTHFGFFGDGDALSLIHWLSTNQQNKAGTVWIAYDYSNNLFNETTTSIKFDGTNYTTMDNFALTVQGGWQGIPLSTALHTADPYSYFTSSTLTVTDWGGAVTINNLVLGVTTNVAIQDAALTVSTKGNIKLSNVIFQNNQNLNINYSRNGIILNNNSGTVGTVTLLNVISSGNEGDGLDVYARGAITATNTIVERNGVSGAYFNNSFAPTDQPVTLTGFQQFNENNGIGLNIYSSGQVTVGNLSVTGNSDKGALIDNTGSVGFKGVTISGSNLFSNNGSDGLSVLSKGNISLSNATSINNMGYGISLDNCFYNGTGCVGKGSVNISGTTIASGNGGVGISVGSFGTITVSNLTSNSNGPDDSGARLFNAGCNFNCSVYSQASVILLGYGTFLFNNSNAFYSAPGLLIYSGGAVTTNNLTANVNGGDGVYIAGKTVTLKGVNVFNYNHKLGLNIPTTIGTTSVNSVTANGNSGGGVYIKNSGAGVLLSGINAANDNQGNGFYIDAVGAVTVNNIVANGNLSSGNGLYINSSNAIVVNSVMANGNTSDGVYLENDKSASKPFNITLNGFNTFSENLIGGIEIFSYGAVVINNATASNNQTYHGIYVNNQNPLIAKPVTFSSFVVANANGLDGVDVLSDGVVTMSNVSASQNNDEGLNINNSQTAARQNAVTILGSSLLNQNYNSGLYITSYGAITLNNVTANGNGHVGVNSYGAFLSNTGGLLARNVTLTSVNNFNQNYVQGLWIYSSGSALLNRVNADNNDWENVEDGLHGDGIVIYANGSITLTCSHTVGNVGNGFGYGYVLTSYFGTISLKGIYSHYNGSADYTNITPIVSFCALP